MPDKFFSYLIFTTVGLFFLALLSYLIQPKYETSIKQGGEVFEDVKNKLDDIKEINIDNKIKNISITKDQNNWYMSSKFGYKVKNEIVRKNLIQISELRFYEKKTKEESLYSRLDLDYPNNDDGSSKLVSILNQKNEKLVEFILGKKRKDGVYIKKLKNKQTWLTSGNLDMSTNENDWLETQILKVPYEDIKELSIKHSNKTDSFSLTKDKNNENIIINDLSKDQIPKSDLIANFLGYFLNNLTFDDVIDREKTDDKEFVTKMKFTLFNESNILAIIFNQGEEKLINFYIDDKSDENLKQNKKNFVDDIQRWSYKLPLTKYNVSGTKLEDLLVED